jgi:hypothetical protein
MKTIKLLVIGLIIFVKSYGQNDKPANTRTITVPSHPSQEIKSYTPQQEFDLAKQISKGMISTQSISNTTLALADRTNPALSAEGAASVRFKDVPVNLATGAMSLPISLDYNGSGMKNQEVASWCGANWSLNAGGMITRMVRGLPD